MRALLSLVLVLFATMSQAATLRYDLSSTAGAAVSGHIEFDTSTFDLTDHNQFVSNDQITSLYIDFAGQIATLADVAITGWTIFDHTGPVSRIIGAAGYLTTSPSILIRNSGAPFELNMELFQGPQDILFSTVKTTPAKVDNVVPLPASGILLLAGLGGLLGLRRSRKALR